MAKRMIDLYPIDARVDLFVQTLSGKEWVAGCVVAHDHPAVWVALIDGRRLFVTNRQQIRRTDLSDETVQQLIALNQRFYDDFSAEFASTRQAPWDGFRKLLSHLPDPLPRFLDVGCGNGRLGNFLFEQTDLETYVGVDFSTSLLSSAQAFVPDGQFFLRDLGVSNFLDGLDTFPAIACVATLQHVPSLALRERVVAEMADHLESDGVLVLANWQVTSSERQRKKIAPWAEFGIDKQAVLDNDFLVRWRRGGDGVRYVAEIDSAETERIAQACGLKIKEQFRSDGAEGTLNLYTILTKG